MTNVELLFACLRCTICGAEMASEEKAASDGRAVRELYALSVKHDLAHLVCDALQKNGLLPENEWGRAFQKQRNLALYRYIQQSDAYEEVCRTFEAAGIQYVPLKGAVIRTLYQEPWMRTSCDIDILVPEEELDRAVSELADKLNFGTEGKNYHDVSLYAPNGVHLELHFHIKESADGLDRVLERVWEYVEPEAQGKMCSRMTNEFFLFHHLAHMSYHFVTGGCGLRPFVDCCLLGKELDWDQEVLDRLLEQGGIKLFADRVFSLGQKQFGVEAAEMTAEEARILNYVLCGGVYGSKGNHIRSQQARRGSAAKNMLNRIWIPYDTLKNYYGSLEGRRFMLPVYEVRRWLRLIFKEKKAGSGIHELKENLTVSDSERNEVRQIFEDLGLMEEYHD